MIGERLRLLQERYSDPLLTALTLMLAILLFVVGPLQAAGVFEAHHFGIAFAFVLLAAVFVVSRSALAIGTILLAIELVVSAGVLRRRHPSDVDIFLDATSWLITGITLGTVVWHGPYSRRVASPSTGSLARCCFISASDSSSSDCFVLSRWASPGRSMVSRRFKTI
jgi:hypothetical protein